MRRSISTTDLAWDASSTHQRLAREAAGARFAPSESGNPDSHTATGFSAPGAIAYTMFPPRRRWCTSPVTFRIRRWLEIVGWET